MTISLSPNDRKALKAAIVEVTTCLERIDSEKEEIKAIVDAAEEKFGIKKKFINKMAKTMYNHNYADLQQETEHFEFLYEAVVENPNP